MTDYNKSTGSTGTMRIRDTGTAVEFWLNSGNSTTFNHALPWSYTDASGTSGTKFHDYSANEGWSLVRRWTVTTDQTVTFRIGDTGTSGFGGPTSFSVTINRSERPDAPSTPTISNITHNSMTVSYVDGSNNGATITSRQTARNTSNTLTGATLFGVDKSTTFTGLASATTYYWWARTFNSNGWSNWSGVKSATTYRVADAPDPPIISDISQTSFWVSFTANGTGGTPILEYRVYYNTQPNETGIQFVTYVNGVPRIVEGLLPATTYYVWTRVRNAAGWSPYSEMRTIRTIAGAWVTVGAVRKEAIPYVRVGGIWKLARPWGRLAGVWKETT